VKGIESRVATNFCCCNIADALREVMSKFCRFEPDVIRVLISNFSEKSLVTENLLYGG